MTPRPPASAPVQRAGAARVDIRVVPRSARTAVGGLRDGRLLVRVTAPPVDDAANEAVIAALAAAFAVPRRAIRLVAGATARNKTVEIAGLPADAVAERMAALAALD